MPTHKLYQSKRTAPLVTGILLASSAVFLGLGGRASAEASSDYTKQAQQQTSYVQGADYHHTAQSAQYGDKKDSTKPEEHHDSKDMTKKEDKPKPKDHVSYSAKPVAHENKQYEPKKEYTKPEQPKHHEVKPVEHKQEPKDKSSYKPVEHKQDSKKSYDHEYKKDDKRDNKKEDNKSSKHEEKHDHNDKPRQTSYKHDNQGYDRHDQKYNTTRYEPKEWNHAPVYKPVAHKHDKKDKKDDCQSYGDTKHEYQHNNYRPVRYSDKQDKDDHEYKKSDKHHAAMAVMHKPDHKDHHKDNHMHSKPAKHEQNKHDWKPMVHTAAHTHHNVKPEYKPEHKDMCKPEEHSKPVKPASHPLLMDKHEQKDHQPALVHYSQQTKIMLAANISYTYEQSLAYHMMSPHGMTSYSTMVNTAYTESYSYSQQSSDQLMMVA